MKTPEQSVPKETPAANTAVTVRAARSVRMLSILGMCVMFPFIFLVVLACAAVLIWVVPSSGGWSASGATPIVLTSLACVGLALPALLLFSDSRSHPTQLTLGVDRLRIGTKLIGWSHPYEKITLINVDPANENTPEPLRLTLHRGWRSSAIVLDRPELDAVVPTLQQLCDRVAIWHSDGSITAPLSEEAETAAHAQLRFEMRRRAIKTTAVATLAGLFAIGMGTGLLMSHTSNSGNTARGGSGGNGGSSGGGATRRFRGWGAFIFAVITSAGATVRGIGEWRSWRESRVAEEGEGAKEKDDRSSSSRKSPTSR